ncbi:MAG: DUF1801 domain-containing protein [Candidatus Dojkabacteria bacterium]|nr:MAG: DUF1801 domain-containing protein [Candidatus Dojkabacteria bacterium]
MEKKTAPARDIDEYIKRFSPSIQEKLQKIRDTVAKRCPEAIEVISYQMPAFKYKGRILIYFAAWSDHVGVYGISSDIKAPFMDELKKYKASKGTFSFSFDEPIPYELIDAYVEYKMENSQTGKGY